MALPPLSPTAQTGGPGRLGPIAGGGSSPRPRMPQRHWGLRRPKTSSAVTYTPPQGPPREGGSSPPTRARWEGRADVTVTGAITPPPAAVTRGGPPIGHPKRHRGVPLQKRRAGTSPPGDTPVVTPPHKARWGQRDHGVSFPPQSHRADPGSAHSHGIPDFIRAGSASNINPLERHWEMGGTHWEMGVGHTNPEIP